MANPSAAAQLIIDFICADCDWRKGGADVDDLLFGDLSLGFKASWDHQERIDRGTREVPLCTRSWIELVRVWDVYQIDRDANSLPLPDVEREVNEFFNNQRIEE